MKYEMLRHKKISCHCLQLKILSFHGRDREKESAPNYGAYYPFGVDVLFSERKIEHIARFMDLPAENSPASFPSVLIVNTQVV